MFDLLEREEHFEELVLFTLDYSLLASFLLRLYQPTKSVSTYFNFLWMCKRVASVSQSNESRESRDSLCREG